MPSKKFGASRLRPLHAALALALACSARPIDVHAGPPQRAVTTVVANCDDSGPGSLRDAVTNAASGDTIDLTQVGCGRITLTTGALATAADDLTLIGPGAASLTIDGASGSDILFHLGHGTLTVADMTLTAGLKYHQDSPARGGCIYSTGSVSLQGAALLDCEASSTGAGNAAQGGAIYVAHDLSMTDSVISGGVASNPDEATTRGGGVYVRGSLTAKYSTIADCEARSGQSRGGGAFVYGEAVLTHSTVSGNRAWHAPAMIVEGHGSSAYRTAIDNSTITDNIAVGGAFGGVYAAGNTRVRNSTIAFNHAAIATYVGSPAGVGLHVHGSPVTLDLESSIISNNTSGNGPSSNELVMDGNGTVIGANNVVVSSSVPLPPGTIQSDPRLGPLRNNGGITKTRMPMQGSVAIDAGNDVAGASFDQRGNGYPRAVGAAPDIGALEFADDDDLFWDGFDGR
jgi:hypothetical protein